MSGGAAGTSSTGTSSTGTSSTGTSSTGTSSTGTSSTESASAARDRVRCSVPSDNSTVCLDDNAFNNTEILSDESLTVSGQQQIHTPATNTGGRLVGEVNRPQETGAGSCAIGNTGTVWDV